MRPTRTILLTWLAVATAWHPVSAAEPVTPQRPSFSSDPNTTAAGTLELEAGYLADDADGAGLPLALKWGSGPSTELFVGWSPWQQASSDVTGIGDVSVGVRHRFLDGDGPMTMAYQVSGKVPTASADDGLGSGVPDLSLALTSLWSGQSSSVVAYYQAGLIGRPASSGVLVDHALALAVGIPLGDRLSSFLETTGTWRPELHSSDVQGVAGFGFAVRPSIVIDAAVNVVLKSGENLVSGTIGFTVNLGRPAG